MKFIEIRGTDFVNKGAELMLLAVLQRATNILIDTKFVMAPSVMSPFEYRARLGLYQKIQFKIFGQQILHLGHLVPERFQEYYGLVSQKRITCILDASGFSYSDKWGGKSIKDLHYIIKKKSNSDTKLIFLPQAFGPFEDPTLREKMRDIFNFATLIFVRDSASFGHVNELCQDKSKLRLSPDFTSEVASRDVSRPESKSEKYQVTVVPNQRMFDKSSKAVGDWYRKFIEELIQFSEQEENTSLSLLAFEKFDAELCHELSRHRSISVPVVLSDDVTELKHHLSNSDVVIGSRYHAIISAMSAGVPTIGIGWSHKYNELFSEYGVSDLCLAPHTSQNNISSLIHDLLPGGAGRASVEANLRIRNQEKKAENNRMWDEVFEALSC